MLVGLRTYACVVILLASAGLYAIGGISVDTLKGIYAVVGPLAIAALRSALDRVGT